MSLLTRFVAANQRLSKAIEDRLPATFKRHIQTLYKYKAAELINRRPGQVVLDIGGGKECPFWNYLDDPRRHLIIALDLSEEELRRNRQLQHKIVADAAASGFPFHDGSADLVVSRSAVEHIRDNAVFFANCARVLRRGGVMVHAFPGRYAPFALINQLLPNRFARRLVGYLHPEWLEEDNYGFLAFYDRCYFSAVQDLLTRNGFGNFRFEFLYYQSIYFNFFFPLYVLMLAYDLIASALGSRNLASGIVVTAELPLPPDPVNQASDSVRIRRGCERPRFGHSRPPYWQQRFAEAGVDGLLRTRLDTAGGKSDVQAVRSSNSFLRR